MLRVRIAATAAYRAGSPRSTRELAAASAQTRPIAEIEAMIGIRSRYFADAGETIASQGAKVVRMALDKAGIAPGEVKRLILTNSTGFDMMCPATSNALCDLLGMDGTCGCVDLNNACVGFLNALDYGARLVHTGISPVVVVSSELGSQHIRPDDPRPYLIFGDAAAAAALTEPEPGAGVGFSATYFGNRGQYRESVVMRHASLTGQRETLQFLKSGKDIAELAVLGLRTVADDVFRQSGLGWNDIDWIVPHQPNGAMLNDIAQLFSIDKARMVPMVHDVGNVGSCSTAYGLAELYATREVRPGQKILLIGVGAGLSYGALLYHVG
ncbi:MAG: ketoacyl-ACP synthase III [Deltaproteobacteria bacterium]|nr:ketoacyl-ACP synthase III [Deltaproteobacteria bacterium]